MQISLLYSLIFIYFFHFLLLFFLFLFSFFIWYIFIYISNDFPFSSFPIHLPGTTAGCWCLSPGKLCPYQFIVSISLPTLNFSGYSQPTSVKHLWPPTYGSGHRQQLPLRPHIVAMFFLQICQQPPSPLNLFLSWYVENLPIFFFTRNWPLASLTDK